MLTIRAVGESENLEVPCSNVVAIISLLVEIGLTDLPKLGSLARGRPRVFSAIVHATPQSHQSGKANVLNCSTYLDAVLL